MKFEERYNNMISLIEDAVLSDVSNIPELLSQKSGENTRLLADAFQYITGRTLNQYIKERTLVKALEYRHDKHLSLEAISELTSYHDAAAFSKACKTVFHLSPSQITEEILCKYKPLFINEVLSREEDIMQQTINIQEHSGQKTAFGVTATQLAEIKQVITLGAIYGLSDKDAELAYALAKENNCSLERACDFMVDANLQFENPDMDPRYDLAQIAKFSLAFDLSYCESEAVWRELYASGYQNLEDLPDGFFDVYFSDANNQHGFGIGYLCRVLESMKHYGMSAFDFDDVVTNADIYYAGDVFKAIEYFADDEEELMNPTLYESVESIIDVTDGFGYCSIWEFDE